jgi:hypothetical protein
MIAVGTSMAMAIDRRHRAIGRRTTFRREATTVAGISVIKLSDELLWEWLHILRANRASAGELEASPG